MGKNFDSGRHHDFHLWTLLSIILVLTPTVITSGLEDGLLISYEKSIELLDSSTGEVKAKYDTDLNYISDLALINGTTRSVILAELVDGSRTNLYIAQLDPSHSKIQRLSPETFSLVKSLSYDWHGIVLHFAEGNRINNLNVKTPAVKSTEVQNTPQSLAVDSCNSILYWSTESDIYRQDQDGTGTPVMILQNASQPSNLVISGKHLYWMEKSKGEHYVHRLQLETYEQETLCQHSTKNPRVSIYSMAVDEDNQTLYWADWHNSAVWKIQIERQEENIAQCSPSILRNLGTKRPLGIDVVKSSITLDDLDAGCKGIKKPTLPDIVVTTETVTQPEFEGIGDVDQCYNYCLDHEIEETSMNSATTLRSSCVYEKSLGIPICQCQTGFAGSRCQIDHCENLCLNGGQCIRSHDSPQCQCAEGFSGDRCEIVKSHLGSPIFLYLFLTAVVFLSMFIILAILLVWENSKIRQKLAAAKNLKSASNPDIIKSEKSRRVFSGSRSRSKGRKDTKMEHSYTNNDVCGVFTDVNCCSGSGDGSGVVLDLEDCCHMTLCDTPCVEASFARRPRKRTKSHTVSISQVEDGENLADTDKLIHDSHED